MNHKILNGGIRSSHSSYFCVEIYESSIILCYIFFYYFILFYFILFFLYIILFLYIIPFLLRMKFLISFKYADNYSRDFYNFLIYSNARIIFAIFYNFLIYSNTRIIIFVIFINSRRWNFRFIQTIRSNSKDQVVFSYFRQLNILYNELFH